MTISKALKETLFTIWLFINFMGRASVIAVPLFLIVIGSWAWAIVFIVVWTVIYGFLDAI
jgi:hypothetical protein